MTRFRILLACVLWVGASDKSARSAPVEPEFKSSIEADWAAQERRVGREPGSIEALEAALGRGQRLLSILAPALPPAELDIERRAWESLRTEAQEVGRLPSADQIAFYHRVRWSGRALALRNPAVAGQPIVFMKRHRFVCQMLHEYLGYFYDYGDVAGGGVFALERPGDSFEVRDLVAGRLPRGNYTTLALG